MIAVLWLENGLTYLETKCWNYIFMKKNYKNKINISKIWHNNIGVIWYVLALYNNINFTVDQITATTLSIRLWGLDFDRCFWYEWNDKQQNRVVVHLIIIKKWLESGRVVHFAFRSFIVRLT